MAMISGMILILSSWATASLSPPPKNCGVKAEVISVATTSAGDEMLVFKVTQTALKKTAWEECGFVKVGQQFQATIARRYAGKHLHVPALAPGQLKARDVFHATALLNDEPESVKVIHWTLEQNPRNLPTGTSFISPRDPRPSK